MVKNSLGQRGSIGLVVVLLIVVVAVAGGAGYYVFTKDKPLLVANTTTENSSNTATSVSASKTKQKACDVISLEDASALFGTQAVYVDSDTPKDYEDEGLWTSICSFTTASATVAESPGFYIQITEALAPEGIAELDSIIEANKQDNSAVDISGLGERAFRMDGGGVISADIYYVKLGNKWLSATAGTSYSDGALFPNLETKSNYEQAEALLRLTISRL